MYAISIQTLPACFSTVRVVPLEVSVIMKFYYLPKPAPRWSYDVEFLCTGLQVKNRPFLVYLIQMHQWTKLLTVSFAFFFFF
uniref:Uncharacterized protein n=1 Tax=Trypanosoma vivax (strain Y486) TaxID=1055687 RepID=G0TWE5_TRYVY|nr:hypothetical protein TVY486_0600740 [Trypanosoma vivax Y486]